MPRTTTCGSTFSVLHNDRIGLAEAPGRAVRHHGIVNPNRITCARASHLFSRFLQDFNGVLPEALVAQRRESALRGATSRASASRLLQQLRRRRWRRRRSAPGRATRTKCPTFQVLNDDLIDGQRFRKGTYQMTALGRSVLHDGIKPAHAASWRTTRTTSPGFWRLDPRTGTFLRDGSGKGFQVNLWR